MRALNPRLIYAAITGFGTQGPQRDLPAYDPVIQAHAGLTASQGQGSPVFIRNLMCDKITAYTACQAVTAALYQREKTGEGQHIDLSMMDAGLYFAFPDGFMHHTLLDDDDGNNDDSDGCSADCSETCADSDSDGLTTINRMRRGTAACDSAEQKPDDLSRAGQVRAAEDPDDDFRPGRPLVMFEGRFAPGQSGNRNYDIHPDGDRFLMLQAAGPDPLRRSG